MRTVSPFRLAILSALLVTAALLVNGRFGRSAEETTKEPLRQVLDRVGEWHLVHDYPMDDRIVEVLKLDDYLFRSYGRDDKLVNLYVGYYRTAKKVGAAHDPLVCFQGQGWEISNRESGEYSLRRNANLKISYSSMIAERQGERELIVYWFQANSKATASTQSQKIALVMDKFSGKSEDNAFVRISAPIDTESPGTVRKRLLDFIEDFYPEFYRYITHT
jgi:EpsI family protein